MLFNPDKYVCGKLDDIAMFVVGYEDETKLYVSNVYEHTNNLYEQLKNIPHTRTWVNESKILCHYGFTNKCCENYINIKDIHQFISRRICQNCVEFYESETSVHLTNIEYDTYIMPYLSKKYTFLYGFTNCDNCSIILKGDYCKFNLIYIWKYTPRNIMGEEMNVVVEYTRRKYIRRLLMFAQTNLIKDVISEIAGLLISL